MILQPIYLDQSCTLSFHFVKTPDSAAAAATKKLLLPHSNCADIIIILTEKLLRIDRSQFEVPVAVQK